jgi:DNA-directed RNA polymerase subunit RPC12/RpoP
MELKHIQPGMELEMDSSGKPVTVITALSSGRVFVMIDGYATTVPACELRISGNYLKLPYDKEEWLARENRHVEYRCARCGDSWHDDEYYPSQKARNGRQSWCKACVAEGRSRKSKRQLVLAA